MWTSKMPNGDYRAESSVSEHFLALNTCNCPIIGAKAFECWGNSPKDGEREKRLQTHWRRGWDSNPRYTCAYSGFRDRYIQPLCHLSGETYFSRLGNRGQSR